jgi:zinc protease
MKKSQAVALLGALSFAGAASGQRSEQAFFPYPIRSEKLKNGLTVVRVPFPSRGLVAYYTVVRVGSRNEVEPHHTGFAHFFEHVMFKGTKRFPEGAREKLLASLGFNDNAFTSDDFTLYHSFGPSAGLEQVVEVEADRFRNLAYSQQTFQTEAKAVLGEYHKSAANPELKIEEELGATAFKRHTYRHTTLGFYDDIKRMPGDYRYSLAFFRRWYTPDNTLLFVVGDFDDAKLMQRVRRAYGPWRGRSERVRIPAELAQNGKRQVHIDWATPTLPRLIYAWHTPASTLTDKNAAIQQVLGAYLVGPTSPLHKELVLEKQLAETVGTRFYDHRDPHLFSLQATLTAPTALEAAATAFQTAVKELSAGEVDAGRLNDIKSNLRYGLPMGLETAEQVAEQLATYAGAFGMPNALDQHYRNLTKVTAVDLTDFASKYLTGENLTVLTLTPKSATASVKSEGGSR